MAQPELVKDIEARVKKSGDTMTGNLIGKYFQGTWLQTTDITDLNSSSSKIAVIKDDGWIYYRTPSELAKDIGLTNNYVLKTGDTMTGNLTAPQFNGYLNGIAYQSYMPYGFTKYNTIGGWGLQTGSCIIDWESDGGDIDIRKNCPNSGQISIKVDGRFYQNEGTYMCLDTNNFSGYALPLSGGTMAGPLNFANNTWNNVGDDVAIGDANVAGTLCVKGINGAPGIRLFDSSGNIVGDVYHTGKKPTPADIGAIPTSASCNKNWNWSGQDGQPYWLWGSNDGTNMYVYNPSNFNVNYANSANYANGAGNSDTVDGWHMNLDPGGWGIKPILAGTGDMVAGSTALSNGHIYLVYE